jgi:hypothetical protein
VGGELQDGTLTVGTSGDDTDIGGVVNGGDDTGGQDDLLPIPLQHRLDTSTVRSRITVTHTRSCQCSGR